MTAPLCPVHKRPGRYVFGSMVICELEDAELAAAKAPVVQYDTAQKKVNYNHVSIATPRAPQVGDRAFLGNYFSGTVASVSPDGRYVTIQLSSFTALYEAKAFTYLPPVTP